MPFAPLLYIALIIAGVYIWKKYNDVRYYWYIFPISVGLAILIWEYISDTLLGLSPDARAVEFFITSALRVLAVVALAVIAFKKDFSEKE